MVTLADLLDQHGSHAQPFYTSEERMQDTLTVVPSFARNFLAMPCRPFFEMTRGTTLVLNPHSAVSKMFLPGEVGQLLDGAATLTPRVLEKDTQVLVGAPANIPPGMTEVLTAIFAAHPEVDEATLGWKVTPRESGSVDESYLLEIRGATTARVAVSDELGRALTAFSIATPIDVLFTPQHGDPFLNKLAPFYRRRRGLFRRH